VLDREVHEVVLLDVLDDGDAEAGLEGDPVHVGVAVGRLAEGARGDDHGLAGRDAVALEELLVAEEDGHALAHGLAAHVAVREDVAADAARLAGPVQDGEAAGAVHLGDDEADARGADLDDGDGAGGEGGRGG